MNAPLASHPPPLGLALACEPAADQLTALRLAEALAIAHISEPIPLTCSHLLVLTPERLELRTLGQQPLGPIYADFTAGAAAHRYRFGGGRNQPLARAVGLRGARTPSVVDATAGLGRDAFVLAGLGCAVRLVERSPIIAALLHDGLQRARRDSLIGPWVAERMQLVTADSRVYLGQLAAAQRPEVVYLDPMYPQRRKTALAAKELRLLRWLAGADDDAAELLAAALTCAQQRVVVKRPRLAPALAGPPPSFQINTPKTRFDVYRLP